MFLRIEAAALDLIAKPRAESVKSFLAFLG
jgi:hypothetical protein